MVHCLPYYYTDHFTTRHWDTRIKNTVPTLPVPFANDKYNRVARVCTE